MDRRQADEIFDAGREAVVSVLLSLSESVAALTERVGDLERRLSLTSRNSSKPPSSDLPWSPKAQPKKPSGRKRGGQDGHEGRFREMVAPDRIEPVWPEACRCCGRYLARRASGTPRVHQVTDLPPVSVEVTEYQLNWATCSGCDAMTCAELPSGVPRSAFGPRLHALVGTLATDSRVSRRNIQTLLGEVFGCQLSLGAVDGMISRLGDALDGPYHEVWDYIRGVDTARVDETSWKIDGTTSWVWGAFTDTIGLMRIDDERSSAAAERLLGRFTGIVSCDRYGAYSQFPNRQLCWAHLDRNLSALALYPKPTAAVAEDLKTICTEVFATWRSYADEHQDRKRLIREVDHIQQRMHERLKRAADNGRDRKARRFCRRLLREFDGYFTFARAPGVEPTNNDAERGLRRAVITRKLTFGTRTTRGTRTTERLLTAGETCRRQHRSLYRYLTLTAIAAAHGHTSPSLLPTQPT